MASADPKISALMWTLAAALPPTAIGAGPAAGAEPVAVAPAAATEPADTSPDLLEYLGYWEEEDVDWLMAERAVRDVEELKPAPGTERQEQGT